MRIYVAGLPPAGPADAVWSRGSSDEPGQHLSLGEEILQAHNGSIFGSEAALARKQEAKIIFHTTDVAALPLGL